MASEEALPQVAHASAVSPSTEQPVASATEVAAAPEKLDEIEEIDFLLEEIESKIAPLALA
jgi:hypothetical protein